MTGSLLGVLFAGALALAVLRPGPATTLQGNAGVVPGGVAARRTAVDQTSGAAERTVSAYPLPGARSHWFGAGLPLVHASLLEPRTFDYSDPVGGGAAPLIRVRGQENVPLSENFTIGDFGASDGAPYARIALELVDALELVQARLGAPLYVNSGYRHVALNADDRIGGADESQHMAGRAADVWAPGRTPLEIATAALDTLGCTVGLGLGAGFLHLDVRGALASWARDGAAMDEVGFDMWVLERCGGVAPEMELLASADSLDTQRISGPEGIARYRAEMAALARLKRRRHERGAVLLDLRRNVPGRDSDLEYRLAYVTPEHAVAAPLDLSPLIDHAEASENFVYILVAPDGAQEIGIMTLDPEE